MKHLWKGGFAILTALVCPTAALASVSVSISPTTVEVQPGGQTQFTAVVNGTTNSVVLWSLAGTNCAGIACGQINSLGVYTAPAVAPHPNVVAVTATSLADLSASASAAAIIGTTSDITVSVSPASATLLAGGQQSFTATVSGTTITGVMWRVAGSCSITGCGSISPSGVYTAPSTVPSPAQVTIQAVSIADPSKAGSAVVTVTLPVSVSVSPAAATVVTGKQQQFTATVSNTSNTAVNWSLSGSGCSGASCGTISSGGLYTAPSSVPSPAQVSVRATSAADSTKSSTATVTVAPSVAVKVSPASVQLLTAAQQQFTATVSNTSNTGVNWSVTGTGCSGAACGTITSGGLYTAPSSVPNPAQVFVTATSVADATKSSTASVTIVAAVAVSVSPSLASVVTGKQQQFTATVQNTTNTAVTWTVAGSGCSGAACGTISSSGLYTAPATAPSPNQVTVTATSVADTSKSGKALVTITGPVAVSISPASVQVTLSKTQQFSATVTGTTNTAVNWSVTGPGCSGASCGAVSSTGLYTAPFVVPNPAQVFVTATAAADPTKSSTASVTLVPPIAVTISPVTETLTTGAQAHFVATVTGTASTSVTWSVSGSGCSGSACGKITSTGLYTAPSSVPSPPQVTVKVTSVADATSSATATVTIIPPVAVTISPTTAQVVAGEHEQFSAKVTGNSNTAVTWSVTGKGCSGAACGVVSSTGLYSAPGTVPNPAAVTVTATSAADTSKAASATVTILPPLEVSISPSNVQVVMGEHQQFTATVTGSQKTTVSWSVTGSGCSGSACGTISPAGLYSAPAAIPTPAQVTVTATSDADTTKSASATVTIIPPVNITITPASAVMAVSSQQQFEAIVKGSTNTAVDWSVSGAGCSGSGCGTISSAGLYTAPGAVPSATTVIVKASAQIDVSQSASATITLVASEDAKLKGQYAFQFTGFDANGIYQSGGSFTADGNGNITAGVEDANSTGGGPATDVSFTGTYQVGGDNRGTMTFSTATGTQTFRFAMNLAGTSGRFIEFDSTGIRGSGVIEKQNPATFSDESLKGGYVISLAGQDSNGSRIGALGVLYFDGSGNIRRGSSIDVNDGGSVAPTYSNLNGVYRVDGTGRGTLTLSVPGFEGGAFRFAFYVVSAQKLLLTSVDPLSQNNPIFGGPVEMQTGTPYLSSSLSGTTAFSLSGQQGGNSQAEVGRIIFDGISQPLAQFDKNAAGTVTTGNVLTGAYAVQLNGRGTMNLDDSNGHETVWFLYVIGQNHAFLMDATTAAVDMGEMEPQTAQARFSNAAIVGTYLLGSGEPLAGGAPLYSGVISFDGRSAMSGTEDISQSSGNSTGQALAGSYSVPGAANTGRGTLALTTPSGKTLALWVVGPAEVLGLDLSSANAQPVVLYFEQ